MELKKITISLTRDDLNKLNFKNSMVEKIEKISDSSNLSDFYSPLACLIYNTIKK